MHMLCIDYEAEDCMRLGVTTEGKRMGCILADQHAIRYGVKLAKGAIPIDSVERIEVITDTQGISRVEIYTKADSNWNENAKRNYPLRFFLGLIKKSEDGQVTLGGFENRELADRFRRFLSNMGYLGGSSGV